MAKWLLPFASTGTGADPATIVWPARQLVWDTTHRVLRVGDGAAAGGVVLLTSAGGAANVVTGPIGESALTVNAYAGPGDTVLGWVVKGVANGGAVYTRMYTTHFTAEDTPGDTDAHLAACVGVMHSENNHDQMDMISGFVSQCKTKEYARYPGFGFRVEYYSQSEYPGSTISAYESVDGVAAFGLNLGTANINADGTAKQSDGQIIRLGSVNTDLTALFGQIFAGYDGSICIQPDAAGTGKAIIQGALDVSDQLTVKVTDPVAALFKGAATNNTIVQVDSPAGKTAYLSLLDDGTAKYDLSKNGSNGFNLYSYATNISPFAVTAAGQIDLLTPAGQPVNVTAGGTGGVTLASGASDWSTPSDGTLKNWSSQQTDYRPHLKAITTGDFTWKDNGNGDFGAIAQNLYAVLDGTPLRDVFVQKPVNDDEPYRVVWSYAGRLALWGVKDLYGLIDAQDDRIAALEHDVTALKAAA
jgi:hypothetical protein